jgi:hypothetical protein
MRREAGDAERIGILLQVPAAELSEIEVGRAGGQQHRLDRIEVTGGEQEHVAVDD